MSEAKTVSTLVLARSLPSLLAWWTRAVGKRASGGEGGVVLVEREKEFDVGAAALRLPARARPNEACFHHCIVRGALDAVSADHTNRAYAAFVITLDSVSKPRRARTHVQLTPIDNTAVQLIARGEIGRAHV